MNNIYVRNTHLTGNLCVDSVVLCRTPYPKNSYGVFSVPITRCIHIFRKASKQSNGLKSAVDQRRERRHWTPAGPGRVRLVVWSWVWGDGVVGLVRLKSRVEGGGVELVEGGVVRLKREVGREGGWRKEGC